MVCPIIVEDLNPPRQMFVQMLCEEQDFFLKIADFIKGIGLTILMRVMESRSDKIWARFYIEANYDITRIEILMSLVRFHEQTISSQTWDAESDYTLSRVRSSSMLNSTSMFSPNWVSDYGDYLPDGLDRVNFSLSKFPLEVTQDYFPDVLDWGNLEAMPDDAFKCIATSLESRPFHPSLSSTQCDILGNIPKQGNEIVGTHSTNSFGEGKEFDTHLPIRGELQTSEDDSSLLCNSAHNLTSSSFEQEVSCDDFFNSIESCRAHPEKFLSTNDIGEWKESGSQLPTQGELHVRSSCISVSFSNFKEVCVNSP
ncbi:transcription factor LHW [Melia azedarach]|uniref:Transcription factor LHW n=1 Tax=Melia azedarach TaxID=155640 RepID=A0ACC1XXV5_MELAZ|nr:transcription factor LHW [Melia azedarach]